MKKTLQQKFEEFHAVNPHVYEQLLRLARRLKEKGRKLTGIGILFEVLRWDYYMTTDDPNSEYKLNNNLRSRYARFIMDQNPDLKGVFNTRALTAE